MPILFFMKSLKKGFTLYELVVSISIFALVAVAVVSFIVYVNSFIKNAKVEQQKIYNQTLLQKYCDLWFSYYDNSNYQFVVENSSTVVIRAMLKDTNTEYKITTSKSENGLIINFEFPQDSAYKNTTLKYDLAKSFYVKKYPELFENKEEDTFSFSVYLHVNDTLFNCKLSYYEAK